MVVGRETIVRARGIVTRFGDTTVHDGIDVDVYRGEVLAIVGGSGSGKSTLMREIVMLHPPTEGRIEVFGEPVTEMSEFDCLPLRRRIGVMFQYGALFSSMTVLENIGFPLREHTDLDSDVIDEIAQLKLVLAGLEPKVAARMPSELSGGMRKRVAMARAIALDPEMIFLDEPSSGLDPVSADALDSLILKLKELLGLTIVMVTHDMDSLWRVSDRVVLLGDARILGQGSMQDLKASDDAAVQRFFGGQRGRGAAHDSDGGGR
ncbi:MAG: ATP-binding cassette domain-containing protein [Pseudomonadota bacterium]